MQAVAALILDEGKLAEQALLLHRARHLHQNACHDYPLADWECCSRASGSAGGATRDVKGTVAGGAAAEGAVASCAGRGDGGAVAAAGAAAGACVGGGAADTSGRGEDEEVGDQGDLGFQLSLGGALGPPRCVYALLHTTIIKSELEELATWGGL